MTFWSLGGICPQGYNVLGGMWSGGKCPEGTWEGGVGCPVTVLALYKARKKYILKGLWILS